MDKKERGKRFGGKEKILKRCGTLDQTWARGKKKPRNPFGHDVEKKGDVAI